MEVRPSIWKLDGNYTRMLRAILNKSWQQHPTKHQLYAQLPPITKTVHVRRTRHAGHCWRSKDELLRDVLLWSPTYDRTKAGRLARTYIQQLCEDTEWSPEDLPKAMNDREKWLERVKDIRAGSTTWWWWYIYKKLVTVVKGDPKAPFSIPTTRRCRESATPFPGLLHFTLDPYIIMVSVNQSSIKYHFLSLWYDSTSDWTQVSRAIGEYSNHYANPCELPSSTRNIWRLKDASVETF